MRVAIAVPFVLGLLGAPASGAWVSATGKLRWVESVIDGTVVFTLEHPTDRTLIPPTSSVCTNVASPIKNEGYSFSPSATPGGVAPNPEARKNLLATLLLAKASGAIVSIGWDDEHCDPRSRRPAVLAVIVQ
jgi:hypothetical protein